MIATEHFFSEEDLQFLENYLNTYAPTGFEAEGQKVWLEYLKPAIDEYHVDNYGTVYGVVNPQADFKVVIEAHADEISWYVASITADGLLYVRRNGGSDHQIAPSKRVWIHTDNGKIPGVFGWPAIHLRKSNNGETPPKPENIFVDCGCISAEEVKEKGIHPGAVITFQDGFFTLNQRYFGGRALDNRIGGFMIAKVARLIQEEKRSLPFGLYIVNSVQEEVGLHGAAMIAHTIKPNCAIITDVAHDTSTPMIDKNSEGDYKCGKGPILTIAPAVHHKLFRHLRTTADKCNISYQIDASSRSSGTDTDAWAYSQGGIPSALVSLPLRYMHTTVELVAKSDVEQVIRLIKESVVSLSPDFNFKYL
jgi:putative aminopeptidase FrvX